MEALRLRMTVNHFASAESSYDGDGRSVATVLALVLSRRARVPRRRTIVHPARGPRGSARIPNVPLYFEAASIKQNKDGGPDAGIKRQPGGRLNTVNTPVNLLITFAYQLQGFQLVGCARLGQERALGHRRQVRGRSAAGGPGAGADHMMLAMRTLLADRFKLKFTGRRARWTSTRWSWRARAASLGRRSSLDRRVRAAGVGRARRRAAGHRRSRRRRADGAADHLRDASSRPGMHPLQRHRRCPICRRHLGSGRTQVVDRTGLTGEWSFELTFAAQLPGARRRPASSCRRSIRTRRPVHRGAGAARSEARGDQGSGGGLRRRQHRAADRRLTRLTFQQPAAL